MRQDSSFELQKTYAVERMVDLGDVKKKSKKMADKTKEAAHKVEHRAEEAGEKAKDTVKRQT